MFDPNRNSLLHEISQDSSRCCERDYYYQNGSEVWLAYAGEARPVFSVAAYAGDGDSVRIAGELCAVLNRVRDLSSSLEEAGCVSPKWLRKAVIDHMAGRIVIPREEDEE